MEYASYGSQFAKFKSDKQSFEQHVKNVLKESKISDVNEFQVSQLREVAETFQENTFIFIFQALNFLVGKEDCDLEVAEKFLEAKKLKLIREIENSPIPAQTSEGMPSKTTFILMVNQNHDKQIKRVREKKIRTHSWAHYHTFAKAIRLGTEHEWKCLDCGQKISFIKAGGSS